MIVCALYPNLKSHLQKTNHFVTNPFGTPYGYNKNTRTCPLTTAYNSKRQNSENRTIGAIRSALLMSCVDPLLVTVLE
jgi:hypothetical protein